MNSNRECFNYYPFDIFDNLYCLNLSYQTPLIHKLYKFIFDYPLKFNIQLVFTIFHLFFFTKRCAIMQEIAINAIFEVIAS